MNARTSPPDDIDKLLADFYRAEMPSPWPRWTAPTRRPSPAQPAVRSSLAGGRAVLTAAVLALVCGVWVLAGWRPAPPTRDGGLNDGTATRPAHLKLTGEEPVRKSAPPR